MQQPFTTQLIRDLARLARKQSRVCQHPACNEHARYGCDNCDAHFCEDHGTKGGDRQVQDVGAVAYPSVCWKCGGYNADEGIPEGAVLDPGEAESDMERARR